MAAIQKHRSNRPIIISSLIFLSALALTQYITYERYLISKKNKHEELGHELNNVTDRLKTILNYNVSSVNALAIIYKEYGEPKNFDSIAKQILNTSKYIDFIQLAKGSIITKVYPLAGNESVIGFNLLQDSFRKKETLKTIQSGEFHFVGPHDLIQGGGKAIFCRFPIFIDGKFYGFSIAITKLSTIITALGLNNNDSNKYIIQLSRVNPITNKTEYFFSNYIPGINENTVSVEIPEGDWRLYVAYNASYSKNDYPFALFIFGLLLSFMISVYAYWKLRQPYILRAVIDSKTHLLNERIKELATIYLVNNILLDESKSIDAVFNEIVNLLPPGWQYPDVCAARIVFDGNEFCSVNYTPSSFKQDAPIKTQDGRAGLIEVVYTKEMPNEAEGPFLKEERDLINALADIIEVYFNKKSHQDALAKSEANLKTIFDTTDTGYVLVDKKLKIIARNKYAADFANNEIGMAGGVGDHLADFFLDERKPVIEKLIPQVFNGKSFNYDANYPQPGGAMHWYNIRLYPIAGATNEVYGLMIAIDNITERRDAEEALKRSEANLKSIFDTTHVSYLLLDNNLTVIAYNQYLMNWYNVLTGITMRAGDNFLDQTMPDKRESIKKIFGDVIATSTPIEYDTTYTNGNETMHVTITVTPIINNKKTIGICVAAHDITNRKLIEIERQKMITDLLQRNRDLEQFSYIISHNVRGPLATMLGLNSLLKEEPVDESLGYLVDGIGNSAEKLDDVLRDLNEILHIRNDSSEIKQEVNLYEEIESVKKNIAPLIDKSKAVIECDFTAVSSIVTTRSYISSICYNLITNAIKFARPGIPPHMIIRSEKRGEQVCISFSDNGLGLDTRRYADRIFGLYQRFHPHIEGKGLGLFMTKTQVEAMNGRIEIESTPGNGAIFRVSLPV